MADANAADRQWTARRGLDLHDLEPDYLEVTVWPDGQILLRGDDSSVARFLSLARDAGTPVDLDFRSPCG